MAKFLKDVLKGKNTTTKKTNDLGGYEPKAGDEEKFAKKHEIDVHDKTEAPEHQFKGGTKEAKFPKQKDGVYEAKEAEDVKCNHTPGQTWCPMHKMTDCSSVKNIKEAMTPKQKQQANRVKTMPGKKGNVMAKSNFEAPFHNVHAVISKGDGKKETVKHEIQAKDKHDAMFDIQMLHHKAGNRVHDTKYKGIVKEEALDEVLTKSTTAGETIKDFVHSKNPKFAGKSAAKRKQMALAAYYAKQRNEDLAEPLLQGDAGNAGKGDGSAEMVKTELKALANKALNLVMHMPESMHIEPWVQAKIAMAKAGVSAVHDYMIYGNHENEQTDTPMDLTTAGSRASNPTNSLPDFAADVDTGRNV